MKTWLAIGLMLTALANAGIVLASRFQDINAARWGFTFAALAFLVAKSKDKVGKVNLGLGGNMATRVNLNAITVGIKCMATCRECGKRLKVIREPLTFSNEVFGWEGEWVPEGDCNVQLCEEHPKSIPKWVEL